MLRRYTDSGVIAEAYREPLMWKFLKETAMEGLIIFSQMVKGFGWLVDSLNDLSIDIPMAKSKFHTSVPQAIAEEWLATSFSTFVFGDLKDEEDEKVKMFKEEAVKIIHAYFVSDDIPELLRNLEDLAVPELNSVLREKSIVLAMDRINREKEIASVLLSALHTDFFSNEDIVNGFIMLLESADDTLIDVLDATNELALILARAILNDDLVPLNLDEINSKLALNCSGTITEYLAKSLLAVRRVGERILWADILTYRRIFMGLFRTLKDLSTKRLNPAQKNFATVDLCFDQLVSKLSEKISAYFKSRAASEQLDPLFLFAVDNGDKYLVQPIRFDGIFKMRRVKLLSYNVSFLKSQSSLNTTLVSIMIDDYLGEREAFPLRVMHAHVDSLEFQGMQFDEAIRTVLQGTRLLGEAQKRDRIIEKFVERYRNCNPKALASADAAIVLIMLHMDVHNPMVKSKRTADDILRNNHGIDDGKDLPEEYLRLLSLYIILNIVFCRKDAKFMESSE